MGRSEHLGEKKRRTCLKKQINQKFVLWFKTTKKINTSKKYIEFQKNTKNKNALLQFVVSNSEVVNILGRLVVEDCNIVVELLLSEGKFVVWKVSSGIIFVE